MGMGYEQGQSWVAGNGGVYTYSAPLTRVCGGCRANFPWDGTEAKKLCITCYAKNVKKCSNQKINGCGNNLRIGAPTWQTECLDCYLKKKAERYGTCPTCPPEKARFLSRPLDKLSCFECAHRLVLLPTTQFPVVNQ